jgi:hypothetical protein
MAVAQADWLGDTGAEGTDAEGTGAEGTSAE